MIDKVLSTTSESNGIDIVDRFDPDRGFLVLRGLEAGPGISIQVVDADQNLFATSQKKIVISAAAQGTSGEVNTASNLGTGVGLFAQKSGVDLQFKSLIAGNNIDLVVGPNSITIDSTGITNASNIGTGAALFAQKTGSALEFRNIKGTGAISVEQVGGDVVIHTTAETNDGLNLGIAGAGKAEIFAGKNGSNLQFKRLTEGANISITQDGQEIIISAASTGEVNVGNNLGTGRSIYRDKAGAVLNFRTLEAGSNVTLTENANSILIDASSDITGGTNVGASGIAVFSGVVDRQMQFKTIQGGGSISVGEDAGVITISADVGEANTTSALGTESDGVSIVGTKNGTDLPFKRIKAGSNITITETSNAVIIDGSGSGMASIISDTAPQLGGDLDVNGHAITSVSNGDIYISPNGSGQVVLDGMAWPSADGTNGQVLTTDGAGALYWSTVTGSGGSGEVNNGVSVGSGTPIYQGMSGTNIEIRSLAAKSNKVTVGNTGGTVEVDVVEANIDRNALGGGPLSAANGGFGVDVTTNQAGARSVLGLGTMAIQNANAVSITGGTINGAIIGGSIAAAGTFTNLTAQGTVTLNGLVMPSADGTNGQFLATDGAGNLSWATPGSGGSGGEANDGANLGIGTGLYAGKTGATLNFKSLVAGSNVTLASDGTTVTISATGGSGSSDFLGLTDTPTAYTGHANKVVTVNSGATGLDFTALATVATTGSINDLSGAANVAKTGSYADLTNKPNFAAVATSGLYSDLSGRVVGLDDLADVNAASPTDQHVLTWDTATSKWIAKAVSATGGATTFLGLTDTPSSYTGAVGQYVRVKTDGTGLEFATVSGGTGDVSGANNVGTGSAIYKQENAGILEFRTLKAASSKVSVATTTDDVTVDVVEANIGLNNLGGTLNVNKGGTGVATFTINGVVIGNGANALTTTVAPSSSNTYLHWNGTAFEWAEVTASASASNIGNSGVGVFKQVNGGTLEFKKINAGSTKISVADDTTNNEIDIDVVEANLALNNIGGTLGVAKGGTGVTTLTTNGVLLGNGTGGISATAAPTTADTYLKWNGSAFTWAAASGAPTGANLTAGSNKVSVTGGTGAVLTAASVDVNEANLSLNNIGGTLGVAKGGTGATTFTANALILGNGTSALTSLAPTGTNTYLKWTGSAFTWDTNGGGPSTGGVDVKKDGTSIVAGATTINFTGSAVTVTDGGSGVANVAVASGGSGGLTKYEVIVGYVAAVPTNFTVPSGWAATYSSSVITITHNVGSTPVLATFWGKTSTSGTRYQQRNSTSIADLEYDGAQMFLTATSTPANYGTINDGEFKAVFFF
jgi:hypothetical protein